MAWMRNGRTFAGVLALALVGCTQANNWWAKHVRDRPAIAMRPASIAETAEAEPTPADSSPPIEPAPDAAANAEPAAAQSPVAAPSDSTDDNGDQVREYIERLSAQSSPGPKPGSPPTPPTSDEAPKPAHHVAAESAPSERTSANAPVALTAQETPVDMPSAGRTSRQVKAVPVVSAVHIRSAQPVLSNDGGDRTLSANQPLDSTAAAREMTLSGYVAKLEAALKKSPADLDTQWRLSALRLALGEEDKALSLSPELAQEQAQVLSGAIELFSGVRRTLTDPSAPAEAVLAQLDELRQRLNGQADLEVPVVALCTRVMTFGVYDEMPADQLVPYQANRTIVYSEVRNFTSRPAEDGKFETMLLGKLELLTPDGKSVWRHEEPNIRDVSKQRRGDFFLAQLVSLPPNLAPGDYVLKVMIQDLLAGKANEGRLEFSVKGTQLTRK